jgi:broad specificity phosphatase PhoE
MNLSANSSADLFNESDLPHINLPSPALPLSLWAILFRSAAMLGFSRHGESQADLKLRVRVAASELHALSEEHGSVLLLGHGFMNHLIGKQLRKQGWHCIEKTGHQHWSYSVYQVGDA